MTAPDEKSPAQDQAPSGTTLPVERPEDASPPAAERVAGTDGPATEAEREAQETIRSIRRLEESN